MPARRPSDLVSWRLAVVFTLGVVALAASPVVGATVLGCCIAAALIGPVRAVQALTVATLVAYGNPYIIKPSPAEGVLLRLVLLAAIVRLVPTMRSSDLRLVWPVWLFSVAEAFSSMQESPALLISLMKVAELFCGVTAVLIAYNHVKPAQLASLHRWLITLGLTVIGLSGLTLVRPGIALGGDGGLQGLLNQPQALGIFMAPFAAWAITGVLLMKRRSSRLELWIALLIGALIILSKARTAGFGALAGVMVVVITRVVGRRRLGQAKLGKAILISGLACGALAVLAVTTGQVSKIITDYAYKGSAGKAQNLNEAFYASRGGGALGEWNDFLQKPLLGNGFGVYPDGEFPAGVVYFDGIPISAPIEKGFLPTAILQEGGALGGGLLTLVIALLWRRAWRNTDLRWRAMFVACLAINAGECVFMSPGGIGMFDWLLLSLAMFSYPDEPGARDARIPAAGAAGGELSDHAGPAARAAALPPFEPVGCLMSSSLRVLHVISSLSRLRGGPSVTVHNMLKALGRRGVTVEAAATDDDGGAERLDVPLDRFVDFEGQRVRFFPRQSRKYAFSAPMRSWLHGNVRGYDIIHTHELFTFAPLAAARVARTARIPYVMTPHGALDTWGMRNRAGSSRQHPSGWWKVRCSPPRQRSIS